MVVIDPVTTLAVSVQVKKGTYALLIGSGISRAAQIPTGWDIVMDLIRRIAKIQGVSMVDDPADWCRRTYDEDPDYGVLLARLGDTPAERSQILREYIEPSPEERDLGLKLPTEAHRAIAELVASGHVRVLITTNFDRLVESALADLGIVPAVIDSADAAKGTLPLVHNACTLIKLHGDYVDARIKNTTAELVRYPGPINRLLDQIFLEYGLIVCGWSAEWDTALVSALRRRLSPWFATYWVSPREPRLATQELIKHRRARVVSNMEADTFFRRLADSVAALEDLASPELVSTAIARATIKRFIDDPSKRIRLHDLVLGEANRLRRMIAEEPAASYSSPATREEIEGRLQRYESMTEVLRYLLATGCYWGEEAHEAHWINTLERLVSFPRMTIQHYPDLANLRRYPALLALYTAGIAGVARGRYETLRALLYGPTAVGADTGERQPLLLEVHLRLLSEAAERVLAPNIIPAVVLSKHMYETQQLWLPLREYLPDDDRFQYCYDRFEYLSGLARTDIASQQGRNPWGPLGMFAFRRYGFGGEQLLKAIQAEIDDEGPNWEPLKSGMFGGSEIRLRAAKQAYDPMVLRARYM
jgi:hypothetical protein